MTPLEQLQQWIDQSRSIVFFGGAGVSTESGIPDFRSPDGLYRQRYKFPPEAMLSRSFFDENPEEFFRFYRDKMLAPDAKPNAAHKKLAELEAAGSRRVWELHGSVLRNHCMQCGAAYPLSAVAESSGVPRCSCGGIIKPDVVLYEESLDAGVLQGALQDIQEADMLIVGGTSLVVYPAAGLIQYYRGNRLAFINKSLTPYDRRANLVLYGAIGEILGQIQVHP